MNCLWGPILHVRCLIQKHHINHDRSVAEKLLFINLIMIIIIVVTIIIIIHVDLLLVMDNDYDR